MWVVLAINALFLWWIIAGVSANSDNCAGEVGDALEACQTGSTIGTGIGVIFIIFDAVAAGKAKPQQPAQVDRGHRSDHHSSLRGMPR